MERILSRLIRCGACAILLTMAWGCCNGEMKPYTLHISAAQALASPPPEYPHSPIGDEAEIPTRSEFKAARMPSRTR